MHLEAKTPNECDFLISSLKSYFQEWLLRDKTNAEGSIDQDSEKSELEINIGVIARINQYFESYPEATDKYFYLKLDKIETEHLIRCFGTFTRINEKNLNNEQQEFIRTYSALANEFITDFCNVDYNEELVVEYFNKYRNELERYCANAIVQHIENGNEEVYVFCIQSFPGHHYQLATMNTVRSLHAMAGENGFEEAAACGYKSELYNPACFDIEGKETDEYQNAENKVKELYTQFYELTDAYNKTSYAEGSKEHQEIESLKRLADKLFIDIAIEVINTIDFSHLNTSANFCAIVSSHEFSEDEFYSYAKKTIPEAAFGSVFPNAGRPEEDYIDFEMSSPEDIVKYLMGYIKDFYLKTVPEDRYYTDNKAHEYCDRLRDYEGFWENEILQVLEELVEASKPNPRNTKEKHFLSMSSPEGILLSELLQVFSESTTFGAGTQSRLVQMYKKIITGIKPSIEHPTLAHSDLAGAIFCTDPEKYPSLKHDMQTGYLLNIDDYVL